VAKGYVDRVVLCHHDVVVDLAHKQRTRY
jgi:hypothetical protein